MRRIAFFLLLVTIFAGLFAYSKPAQAANYSEVYFGVESFTWEEFRGGTRLLEETGPLFVIGANGMFDTGKIIMPRVNGELFFGVIDYNGQTMTGIPLTSEVNHIGVKFDGDFLFKNRISQNASLNPFIGAGVRWWKREIDSAIDINGNPINGTLEYWTTVYGRLGLSFYAEAKNRETALVLEGGIKLPIYTWERSNLTTETLEPGNEISAFGEVGLKVKRIKITGFYEGLRFTDSDTVPSTIGQIYQPRSTADIFGASIGYLF